MVSVNWTGNSRNVYAFEVYPLGTEFNPVSAVYVVAKLVNVPGRGQFLEALYVGETQSLNDRLNAPPIDHDGLKRAIQSGATHVCVHRIDGATQRLWIETDLRHGLNPSCNAQDIPTNAFVSALLRR